MRIETTEPPCHWTHPHDAHDWLPIVQDPEAERVLHVGMASVRCPGLAAEPGPFNLVGHEPERWVDADVEALADHLSATWPHMLNDGLQLEVAREAVQFLLDDQAEVRRG